MSAPSPKKAAVFLGAGASCPFGLPTTSALLGLVLEGLHDGGLFFSRDAKQTNSEKSEREDMKFLLETLKRIMPGWSLEFPKDKLPLITEILSLIDYSLAEFKPLFPGQKYEDMLRVRRLLERAIYEVLWEADEQSEPQAKLLQQFGDWVLRRANEGGVITTNYDTCLEHLLFRQRPKEVPDRFDFGFAWLDAETTKRVVHPRPTAAPLRWFKLHGSINWVRCPSCEHIYINPRGDIAFQAFRNKIDAKNTCHCGPAARLQFHLVAPSTYRTVRDPNLLEVWKNSIQLLMEASEWFFIGYSLPSEDLAIRSLLMRALLARGSTDPPRVTVVQYGDAALPRYKLLFPGCEYRNEGLEAWLASV